ncbi:MAG: proliferating cell nuclear antigen (pcna) [Actinobacteria bacterium]|nr:proliferating cell nuclear antigen (pcna) [Actinomycetota bacterium]
MDARGDGQTTPGGDGPAAGRPAMLLKSIQGNAIRTLFEVLKEIIHDVSIRVDESGVKLLTLDGARCALVYMRLRADAFEEFRCNGVYTLGLNMASVFKLVKTSGNHDTITLYMDGPTSNELGIKIQNADKNSVTDFKLKLLDVDDEQITLPDVDFDSVITMPSAFFQRLCRDMLNISDTMVIRSTGNQLVLSCNGDFARQETVIGEADAGMNIAAKSEKTIEGRFSLKYLSLFCKASNLSNTIELFLKEAYPLILKYNVASLGELRFCVAPKVDE